MQCLKKPQLSQALEIILFVSMLTVNAQFVIEPESVVQAEGLEAVFECLISGALSHGWIENGADQSSSEFPSDITVIAATSGNPSRLTIPASSQFNNSVVQCVGFTRSGGVFSRNVTLTVEQVAIDVMNGDEYITITVTNKFTTNLIYQLDVTLDNIIVATVSNMSNQFNFNYPNRSLCDTFSFIVTPTTMGMEGISSEPVAGFFTMVYITGEDVIPLISQSEDLMKKIITLSDVVPNCTLDEYITYNVTTSRDVLPEPITGVVTDSFVISFTFPTDSRFNVTVTLTCISGIHLEFKHFVISTTDVRDLLVSEYPGIGINVSIEYVEGTLSPGALVCVLPHVNDDIDFVNMKLVAISQNESDNFTIQLPSGEYRVIAFDLESESVPRLPVAIAADSEESITVTSDINTEDTPSSPPSNEDITVTVLSNQDVQVTCPQPLNCLVLVQSLASLDVLHVRFIESFVALTVFSLDTVSNDNYMVVYSWGSDQTIFDGRVSLITLLNPPTVVPTITESPTTNPPPGAVSQSPLPTEAIAGIAVVGTLLLILIVCVGTTLIVMLKMRKRQYKGPESDEKVDWSSTLSGIEQPNEAYGINKMLKKNIAYEQTKTRAQRQRMDHSPVLTLTEGGEYEDIKSIHQYEEVLPHSQMNTGQY